MGGGGTAPHSQSSTRQPPARCSIPAPAGTERCHKVTSGETRGPRSGGGFELPRARTSSWTEARGTFLAATFARSPPQKPSLWYFLLCWSEEWDLQSCPFVVLPYLLSPSAWPGSCRQGLHEGTVGVEKAPRAQQDLRGGNSIQLKLFNCTPICTARPPGGHPGARVTVPGAAQTKHCKGRKIAPLALQRAPQIEHSQV